jgi:hypothetical protein
MKSNPRPYEWDYDGACQPHARWSSPSFKTFSVGCFQWVPRTGSHPGLKRGKVQKRFSGSVADATAVLARAKAWCDTQGA